MRNYPFNTAYTQTRELYGIELRPDEFESIGLIAWNQIGNKEYKLYQYEVVPTKDSLNQFYVDLPCNVDEIIGVTTNYEDYQKTTPMTLSGDNKNGWVEGYIESRKFNTNPLYTSGKFVKYREEGNRIYLSDEFNIIYIKYKGIVVDDDGLPMLNDKEVDAIAIFCAYTDTFKKGLMSKDRSSIELAQMLDQKWLIKCTQARVPDYFTDNQMDEVLNAKNSWDRKRFGKSFKPIK